MDVWKLETIRYFSRNRNRSFFGPMDDDTDVEGSNFMLPRPPVRKLLAALAFVQDLLAEHGWEVTAWSMDRPNCEGELLIDAVRYRHRVAEREHVERSEYLRSNPSDWCALRPGLEHRMYADSWWTDG